MILIFVYLFYHISLYPMPLTLMIRMEGSWESLRRSLVMKTCRLRVLKQLSYLQRSSSRS